jgi:hypothetical protein
VHTLADSRHDGGGEVKNRIQYGIGYSIFPGVRQALIHSELAIAYNGDGNTD